MASQNSVCKFIRQLSPALLSTLLTACGGTPMTKFDWFATNSAPKHYPMEILSGNFIAPDGYALYIPTPSVIHSGWGEMVSSHVVGPDLKSLPSRLEISFFSYTENTFYQGQFDLPYDTIVRLFNEGYYSPKEQGQTTYMAIMAGVAPGGVVAVWLLGVNKSTEVFFGQAEKTEAIPWSKVLDNPEVAREDFVREVVEDSLSAEALAALQQHGIPFDLWDRYRRRYPWQPVIVADQPPSVIDAIYYFNGEEDYFRYPLEAATAAANRPVPKRIYYIWDTPEGKTHYLGFNFDEAEITAAFQQLSPEANTPLRLEFHTRLHEGHRQYGVQLTNGKDIAVLRKTTRGKKK